MLCCQGGLSNHKLKSAINASYNHNARPSKTDRRTDRWTNIMAIERRFVLTNASRAKNWTILLENVVPSGQNMYLEWTEIR